MAIKVKLKMRYTFRSIFFIVHDFGICYFIAY